MNVIFYWVPLTEILKSIDNDKTIVNTGHFAR
jgi:hypothetical protein